MAYPKRPSRPRASCRPSNRRRYRRPAKRPRLRRRPNRRSSRSQPSARDRTDRRADNRDPAALRPAAAPQALCLLAASVTFAAALGAVIGALASGGYSAPAKPDVAAVEENKAMQQSIAKLGKEVTTLKASLDAGQQIGAHADRQDHRPARTRAADITGSITAPQTTAPAADAAAGAAPRAPRIAAVEPPPPAPHAGGAGLDHPRPRDGYVYRRKSRRDLSSRCSARRCPASARCNRSSGRTAAGWCLTPKGIIVSHARPALFRRILTRLDQPRLNWRRLPKGAAFHLCVSPVACPRKTVPDLPRRNGCRSCVAHCSKNSCGDLAVRWPLGQASAQGLRKARRRRRQSRK